MKRVLITGKDSYIGTSFINWVKEKHPGEFATEELDMIDGTWKEKDFSGYCPPVGIISGGMTQVNSSAPVSPRDRERVLSLAVTS